ncbi:MAG TPA: MMPL family transporter, partial [Deltaproteobacteria bacterium]|nr:MMPL family transporter [Deltaproteobacteria bacterium]
MEKGLKILVEGIIRLRWVFLTVFLVITLGMIYVTKDLQINNDYETWLPTNDRVGDLLRTVDREFSNGSLMFVVLDFTKEGVFTPESLALVERLTRELEGIDELFQVTSLTNIMDIKQTEDGIEVSDLIPSPFPTDRDELKQLEEYVLSKETFRDSLVSLDAGYTLVATSIESVYDEIEITGHLLDIVKSIVGERQYYVGGDVVVAYYMDYYMKQDLMVLVPIIIIGMVFVLAYGLRRITGVIFSFIVVIISIIWTVGMKALFGYPFNILSPAVVVLLMAVGSDYAVHMYNHYLKKGDIRLSTTEIALPIFMSAMTTVAGLATFSVTKIEVLKNFGLELAFGLGAACLLSIILLTILVHMVKGGIIPKDPDDE